MLRDQIQNDLKNSMLSKDEKSLSTIRMLKSAIQYFEIQKGGAGYEATDEDITDVVGKEIKKRKESIEMFEKGGRQELADKEKKELELLKKYLPQQMSEDEIKKLVDETISSINATSMQHMGKVMSIVSAKTKGKADGGFISDLVKERLS